MKTNRIVIVVLSVLVVALAYIALSKGGKPEGEKPVEIKITYTNTVERWYTNTVDRWRTNTVEVWRTNTVVQVVTNEVINEVPAKLSDLQVQAATAGYKYLNAPSLTDRSDPLYKASPVAVDVSLDDTVRSLLGEDTGQVRTRIEGTLRSRSIPVAEKSPYRLTCNIAASWTTDVPGVHLCTLSVELNEKVASQRQGDIVMGSGVVWRTATSKLIRTDNVAEDVHHALQGPLDKFSNDYRRAKEREKDVESRLPAPPPGFLPE